MPGIWTIVFALIIVALIIIYLKASAKPDRFRIERSIEIKAPASKIFPNINGMQSWKNWSPWQNKDPNISQSFGQIEEGIGSTMAWSGNNKVGKGKLTVIESSPYSRVLLKLEFEKPMKTTNDAEFTLREDNGITMITWAMTGPSPFISKVMDTVMNMDRLVGKDFEMGLANLKRISEA
jgi:hypothetical protein